MINTKKIILAHSSTDKVDIDNTSVVVVIKALCKSIFFFCKKLVFLIPIMDLLHEDFLNSPIFFLNNSIYSSIFGCVDVALLQLQLVVRGLLTAAISLVAGHGL